MLRTVLQKTSMSTATLNCARLAASIPRSSSCRTFPHRQLRAGFWNVASTRRPSGQQRWMNTSEEENGTTVKTEPTTTTTPMLVYESPLGSVVAKLRTVSLMTAIIGATGVPCMIAIKGAIPEMGMLAVAMMFVTGSVGSTAAIHFVFSPYVYRIECIPVRQCSFKKEEGQAESGSDTVSCKSSDDTTAAPEKRDMLLKAWTRSLFLRHQDVVFDPTIDVEPYSGMRPLCNFRAKGLPLYVHPEYVYDEKLRKAMNLDAKAAALPPKTNPDDDLL